MTPLAAAICTATAPVAADAPPDVPGVVWPTLPQTAASAEAFAPRGWRVEKAIVADLDGAGAPDLVAVLRGDDPACRIARDTGHTLDTNPRLLLVARAASGGGYRLALANRQVIMRVDDPYMDDPLDPATGLAVANRVITLKLTYFRSAGGWTTWGTTLRFRWDGQRFATIGADRNEVRRNSGETEDVSANYLTRRLRLDTGSIEDDVATRTRWLPLTKRASSLEAIGDALLFDPRK